ncbi:MAG: tetratricopeptide repeat protein, partial [Methylophilaceae bacterium]
MTQYEPEQHDLEAISSQILRWLESADFVAAERSCKMMLTRGEQFKNLWFYLGAACHGQHKYKEALDAFRQAAGEDAENVDIWNAIATTLSSLKRYPEALEAAQQALALSPGSAQCLSNVGIACEQLGQLEQSLGFYQRALQADPMQTNALINLGAVLVKLRRMHEARNHCLNAIACLPKVVSLYNNLAEADIHIFDFQAALNTCEQALLVDSRNAAIHLKRGLVLAYLQRFDEAQGAFIHAQILQPDIVNEYFPDWFQGEDAVRQNGEFSMDARLIYLDSGYQQ